MNCRARGRLRRALCGAVFVALLISPAVAQEGTRSESDPLAVTEDGLIYNSVLSVRLPEDPEWHLLVADVSSVIFRASGKSGEELWAAVVWVPTRPEEMQVGPKLDDTAEMGDVLRRGFLNVMRQRAVLDGGLQARLDFLASEGRTLRRLWFEPLPRYGEMGELCKKYMVLAANDHSTAVDRFPTDTLFFGKVCMHPDLVAAILLEYGRAILARREGMIPAISPEAQEFLDSLKFERKAS